MKSVSRIALGVALVLGGASVVATAPAIAQNQAPQREFKLSKEERAAFQPVQEAVNAKNWSAAAAALPAAQAAARGADARYVVGRFQLEVGLGLNNVQMQAQGIDTLIASGGVPAADLPMLYRNQGALAHTAGQRQKAADAFAKYVELMPNDPEGLLKLAQTRADERKTAEAIQLVQRAIAVRTAAGQAADESWYKYALKLAFDAKQPAQSAELARTLVAAYPTRENWRDALLIYRDLGGLDDAAKLDLLRLMRASNALAGERDWFDLAFDLNKAGLPAEANAVLEEAGAQKMVDLSKPTFRDLFRATGARLSGDRASLAGEATKANAAAAGTLALKIADAYAGYKDYAKAVPLYRAALQKGSVDPNTVNTRLGIALAQSGDRAGAEAAFRAVTGPRAELAKFWMAWLARRA